MIELAARWYARVFAATTVLLILLALLGRQLSPTETLVVLIAGVILLGLPHGALDPMVAEKAFTGLRAYSATTFYLGYLVLVMLYWWLWNRLPTLGLSMFLLIAALHFGSDWESRGTPLVRCAYGCVIVTLPALRFPAEVTSIYTMLGTQHAAMVVTLSRAIAPLAMGIALIGAALHLRKNSSDTLELLTIMAGGLLLKPLVFFTCYFALLHSPRHLLETAKGLGITTLKSIYLATLPVLLATLLLGAVGFALLPTVGLDAGLLRVVFIGLAALTVPHMLLELLTHTANQESEERGLPR